jgi:hypothetical protein
MRKLKPLAALRMKGMGDLELESATRVKCQRSVGLILSSLSLPTACTSRYAPGSSRWPPACGLHDPPPCGTQKPNSGLEIAGLRQAATNVRDYLAMVKIDRVSGKNANHSCFRLLRPRHERPSRRAPKPRNELPPSHSITSSTTASRVGGMVRPSALAVLRLMASSNLLEN